MYCCNEALWVKINFTFVKLWTDSSFFDKQIHLRIEHGDFLCFVGNNFLDGDTQFYEWIPLQIWKNIYRIKELEHNHRLLKNLGQNFNNELYKSCIMVWTMTKMNLIWQSKFAWATVSIYSVDTAKNLWFIKSKEQLILL